MDQQQLPEGVKVIPIQMHHDTRGVFAEMYRKEWDINFDFPQWNIVKSKENTLRGMHVHHTHADYLIVLSGSMHLCLHDIRPNSTTAKQTYTLCLNQNNYSSVIIPPGVVHGFYFQEESIHVYAVSDYWDIKDELGCIWNSPEFNKTWPTEKPILSERDAFAPSYKDMVNAFLRASKQNELHNLERTA